MIQSTAARVFACAILFLGTPFAAAQENEPQPQAGVIQPATEPGSPPEVDALIKTDSGLKYAVLKKGEEGGRKPKLGDQIKVHYKGWLDNGEVFDSSFQRGEPVEFTLGQVIDGWNEGMTHIAKGGQIKLVIPPDLAYGDRQTGQIPPGSRLTFFVQLLGVSPSPDFQPMDLKAEGVNELEEGVYRRLVKSGKGETCQPSDVAVFELTSWTAGGDFILCRTKVNGGELRGRPEDIGLPFLGPALAGLAPGALAWFSVPPGQDWSGQQRPPQLGAEERSVWRLRLLEIPELPPEPKFRKLDEEKAKTTDSGLQYEVVTAGKGDSPGPNSEVTCHYIGWLPKGEAFDSSYARAEPMTFKLQNIGLKGWVEGIQLMKPGAEYLLRLPPELAFGAQGRRGLVPPGTPVIFHIELLEVK